MQSQPAKFLWEHDKLEHLSPDLREKIAQARNFSELIRGASILYNLILAEETRREEAATDYRKSFQGWVDLVDSRWEAFAQWNRGDFWRTIYTGPKI